MTGDRLYSVILPPNWDQRKKKNSMIPRKKSTLNLLDVIEEEDTLKKNIVAKKIERYLDGFAESM
jgi:hypothetical protein